MGLEIIFDEKLKTVYVKDQSSIDLLRNGSFGSFKDQNLHLSIDEALYLIDVRKAECKTLEGKLITFNNIASSFKNKKKFIARYFTYKDWRDRGLILKLPSEINLTNSKFEVPIKKYPSVKQIIKSPKVEGIFYDSDLTTIIDNNEIGKELYEKYWLGQYGTYKLTNHGSLSKLDIFETLFLINRGILKLNIKKENLIKVAKGWREDFEKLYQIYDDWRSNGYVIKTGFKFGTHFRIYFPGATPIKTDENWLHSKHVIQVFPRDIKMLISEWARAIRVAHSVRKTFILAIPGKSKNKKIEIDYVLFHRKGGNIEKPNIDKPRFAMLSLSENEYIGGSELSAIISGASEHRMELIIAIADRETAVTYYKVKKILLPGSSYNYYEIDWLQP